MNTQEIEIFKTLAQNYGKLAAKSLNDYSTFNTDTDFMGLLSSVDNILVTTFLLQEEEENRNTTTQEISDTYAYREETRQQLIKSWNYGYNLEAYKTECYEHIKKRGLFSQIVKHLEKI